MTNALAVSARTPDFLLRRAAIAWRAWTAPIALALTLSLAACGGGGGGSSGPSVPDGSFTLGATSATFSALQGGTAPAAPQSVHVTITGASVAVLGIGYANGQSLPAWLNVTLTGSGTSYTMNLSVLPSAVAAGTYSTTFSVGTANAAGTILTHQDFTVSLTLDARLAITTAPATATIIFGDTVLSQVVPVAVTDAGRTWAATADAAWLKVPAGNQSGNATVNVTIDAAGLAPGSYTAHMTATDSADAADAAVFTATLTVTPASLSVTEAGYAFGGTDGRATPAPLPVTISLSTGQASYPFTVSVATTNGGNWLSVDHASGTVGSAGTTVNLSVNPAVVRGGSYSGQVHVSTTVAGVVFDQIRPVTFNLEANRLVVSAAGVGLSQIAGRSVLTRTVKVFSAIGRTTTPWAASSDSSWLSVTPSGVTGGDLVLSATTTGLPLDSTQFANVTVTSSDPSVENQQTIRVGLLVSNTAPASLGTPLAANVMASSPVEPIVAIGTGGSSVGIYDMDSGQLLRTLTNVAAASAALAFSEDGRTLFVFDQTNIRVNAVDPVAGAVLATYDSSSFNGRSVGSAIAVMHPNGYPMLVTPSGRSYDLTTGTMYTSTSLTVPTVASALAVSPDQSLLSMHTGYGALVVRSALGGGTFVVTNGALVVSTAQVDGGQACFSASGDRVYTASGAPYNFPATSVATGQVVQTLPGLPYPDAIQCVWNGEVLGGMNGYYNAADVFVYNGPTGVSLAQLNSAGPAGGTYRSLLAHGLAVSADGTRLVSAWASQPGTVTATGIYFQTLPPPP